MPVHIGELIRMELARQERSVTWFARHICCSRAHVYKIFQKENLDIKLLERISAVLGHDFFRDISESLPRGNRQIDDTSVNQ